MVVLAGFCGGWWCVVVKGGVNSKKSVQLSPKLDKDDDNSKPLLLKVELYSNPINLILSLVQLSPSSSLVILISYTSSFQSSGFCG